MMIFWYLLLYFLWLVFVFCILGRHGAVYELFAKKTTITWTSSTKC